VGHEDAVVQVRFLGSDKSLLSVGWDGTVRKWSTARGSSGAVATLTHDSPVKSLCVDPDTGLGAAGSQSGQVVVFDLASLETRHSLVVHDRDVSGVCLLNDGHDLLTVSWDGRCRLTKVRKRARPRDLLSLDTRIRAMAVDPNDTACILGLHDGRVVLVEVPGGTVTELGCHSDAAVAVAISPTGDLVATGGWDRTINVWDLSERHLVQSQRCLSGITSLAWSTDGRSVLMTNFAGMLSVWSLD